LLVADNWTRIRVDICLCNDSC